jgi:hypothetical protein
LERRALESSGKERSLETPEAPKASRRLKDLPAESKCPERKSTGPFAGIFNKFGLSDEIKAEKNTILEKINLFKGPFIHQILFPIEWTRWCR